MSLGQGIALSDAPEIVKGTTHQGNAHQPMIPPHVGEGQRRRQRKDAERGRPCTLCGEWRMAEPLWEKTVGALLKMLTKEPTAGRILREQHLSAEETSTLSIGARMD